MIKLKTWLGVLGMFLLTIAIMIATPKIAHSQSNSYDKTLEKASEATSTVYNDLKSMSPKVEQAVVNLSKELKTGVNNVWTILVKQQKVWAIGILLLLFVTIGSWFHFWYRMRIFWQAHDNDKYVFSCILTCLLALGGTILSSMHFIDMLTGFFNPEYGAMKQIANVASQL